MPTIKLINNKSFAQAIKKGAELCLLTIDKDLYQQGSNSWIMMTADMSHLLPTEITQLMQ